ncbi:MAG: hypothetical protein CVV42_09115 [Candidatus Riflebacteria bacterium HGW-Riflebacteria-2]|jgi:hypothetical protein|nr:MAG: hypothetical protein CVV42_09115 [Candidatus Riflebacteria bacterium HGW-Riflebacteria-2]
MAISVKGIQYSYQINFFNQVPTNLKSQVHDLPVVSVLRPTPIDKTEVTDSYLPLAEQAFPYAGPLASAPAGTPTAAPIQNVSNTEMLPTVAPTSQLNAITPQIDRIESTPQYDSAVSEPAQIDRKLPAANANLRPATPLAAQTERDNPLMPAELPAPLPETLPTSEATPTEAVKATPRYEYNLALRAYKPDAGSFLQPVGYEKAEFARAEFFAEPARAVIEPPALPVASSQAEVNPLSEGENRVQPVLARRVPDATPGEELLRREREQPLTAKTEQPEQTMRLRGENFLSRQVFRLYDMISTPAMFNTGNFVDVKS